MDTQMFSVIISAENIPGVMNRVTGIFTRRKINIENMSAGRTADEGISQMVIGVISNGEIIQKVVNQIEKIIEVIDVKAYRQDQILESEMVWIKVFLTKDISSGVVHFMHQYQARSIYRSGEFVVIEKIAPPEQLDALIAELKQIVRIEIVRSGKVAILKE